MTTKLNDIKYGPHEMNVLDLFLPEGGGPAPLAVCVHGGGWSAGTEEDGAINRLFDPLLTAGIAIASIRYRLAPQFKMQDQCEDIALALEILRLRWREFGIDTERTALMGTSAGGHLAALVGLSVHYFPVSAIVNCFGPTDLGLCPPETLRQYVFPALPDAMPETMRRFSPVAYAQGGVPVLSIVGDLDIIAGVPAVRALHDEMVLHDWPSQLIIVPGGIHGLPVFGPLENEEWIATAVIFLKQKLNIVDPPSEGGGGGGSGCLTLIMALLFVISTVFFWLGLC